MNTTTAHTPRGHRAKPLVDPHNPPAYLMDEAAYVRRTRRWQAAFHLIWRSCAWLLILALLVETAWQLSRI